MIRIKSVVISLRGIKRAILLISTTFVTVATCYMQHAVFIRIIKITEKRSSGAQVAVITYFF